MTRAEQLSTEMLFHREEREDDARGGGTGPGALAGASAGTTIVPVPLPRSLLARLEVLAAQKGIDPGQAAADLLLITLGGGPARQATSVGGYRWKDLTLPEGTELSFKHLGATYVATVSGGRILANGRSVSPSQFINAVAGPGRNAWMGIWVRRPGDPAWALAEDLRCAIEMSVVARQAMALGSGTEALPAGVAGSGGMADPASGALRSGVAGGSGMGGAMPAPFGLTDQIPFGLQVLRTQRRRRRRRTVTPPTT